MSDIGCNDLASKALNFILIPNPARRAAADRPISRLFLDSLHNLTQDWFGEKALVLSYEEAERTFHPVLLSKEKTVGNFVAGSVLSVFLSHLSFLSIYTGLKRSSGCINFFNPSFFLFDSPCHRELTAAGQRYGLAICAQKSSRDLFGISWNREGGSRCRRLLHAALGWLTETADSVACTGQELLDVFSVPPSLISCENSSTAKGVFQPEAGKAPDAPIYLNTAFAEAIFPIDVFEPSAKAAVNLSSLTSDLRRQRDCSRTPWIFNSLLNTLEYSAGTSVMTSVPPEIHISSTGLCNLSCRFCSYTPQIGKPGYLTPAGLKNLEVLKSVKSLRLAAGLGEPTLNPALADILLWVAAEHPHIAMNFFTNGVELKPPLQQALVDAKVNWINVSLNAANAATWADLCGVDKFPEVVRNLIGLKKLKQLRKSIQPLVFGSIVLTNRIMHDLPYFPRLCAELGIDRFTGFPFFAFGYGGEDKFGPEACFQPDAPCYVDIYKKTLSAAEKYGVSMELPLPDRFREPSSIMAPRQLYDFCRIERNEHRLDKLLNALTLPAGKRYCFFLWRQAGLGSVNRTLGDIAASHYLYPCLGPLSGMNFAGIAPVDFTAPVDFFTLWNNPLFIHLRRAQQETGLCPVCDLCMSNDTRDPDIFPRLDASLQSMEMDFFA